MNIAFQVAANVRIVGSQLELIRKRDLTKSNCNNVLKMAKNSYPRVTEIQNKANNSSWDIKTLMTTETVINLKRDMNHCF